MNEPAPHGFSERWLRYDPQRPTRSRLLKRFVSAVIGMMIVCALLAAFTAR